MQMFRKLKRLVTGERVDLATGEVVEGLRIHERPDPTPIAAPIGFRREPSIFELVKEQVLKTQVMQLQEELGAETPEEAEDFDIQDPDYDNPHSPYEYDRHEEELRENMAKLEAFQAHMQAKYPDRYAPKPPAEGTAKPTGEEIGGAGEKTPAKPEGRSPKAPPKAPSEDPFTNQDA